MRRPLIALLVGYALCLLYAVAITYVYDLARAICETPGCADEHGVPWGIYVPPVTFAILFTGIYFVWGRGNGGPRRP